MKSIICFTLSNAGRTSKLRFFDQRRYKDFGFSKFNCWLISLRVALSAVAVKAKIGVEGSVFLNILD
jgi:hypothetical protein